MNVSRQRRWTQLRELMTILPEPSAWRALTGWKPFSITAYKMAQVLHTLLPDPHAIIDVGANKGQFSRAMTETYPDTRISAFEPLPDVGRQLEQNLSDAPNVQVDRRAVGATDGRLTIHRYEYSLQSSALPRRPGTSHNPSDNPPADTIDVPVTRLDSAFAPDDLVAPSLLKIDVQGYELEVLEGASGLLPKIDYLLVETGFEQAYEDQPLFDDIYAYLTHRGFQLRAPVDVLHDADGIITQADILFQRS